MFQNTTKPVSVVTSLKQPHAFKSLPLLVFVSASFHFNNEFTYIQQESVMKYGFILSLD